ncbi:hypothetical protein [Pectobacterium sp. CFBP8739]|uniref:hypothetical protein n=1 Tax=Pectobacterium sp. CFBP8739 TaxID=2748908 RepID=UPI0015DE6299|nr:hypothetical protein [Pectobacterium sp. CFBP8739]MBA0167122.1 hypothetical protein [Pectobacterium sp. CFBP8739]
MKETAACYDDLLNAYQRWLTDLTNIAIRNGMCHPDIRYSHCLTVSVLYFPEAGAVTAIVPQYLYRIVHGKKWPDPLFSLDDLRTILAANDELLFTHAGLEGILLSECVRLKQGRLANKLICLFSQFKMREIRHKLVWLCWYDLMRGASMNDWLVNLKLMNNEEICFWLGKRQEENTALTNLMDEYVVFTRY